MWFWLLFGLLAMGGAAVAVATLEDKFSDKFSVIVRHGLQITREGGVCQRAEVVDRKALETFMLEQASPLLERGVTDPVELVLLVFQAGWPECQWPPVAGTELAEHWQTMIGSGLLDELREAIQTNEGIAGYGPRVPRDQVDASDLATMLGEFVS